MVPVCAGGTRIPNPQHQKWDLEHYSLKCDSTKRLWTLAGRKHQNALTALAPMSRASKFPQGAYATSTIGKQCRLLQKGSSKSNLQHKGTQNLPRALGCLALDPETGRGGPGLRVWTDSREDGRTDGREDGRSGGRADSGRGLRGRMAGRTGGCVGRQWAGLA